MNEFPTLRLRFACSEPLKYGANAAAQFDDPNWPRFVRITDITEDGRLKEDTFRSLPPEEAAPYLLGDGDVLLARSGSIGRSFIYKPQWGTACYAGYLIRARLSQRFEPKFVYWALNSASYWAWVEGISIRSTIQNVSAEKYADYAVPAPSLDTQRRIARFLDEKTARIDALIESKRALLDRLAEKRQALITHAVTKGLNPDAPMKPSGIDWLGDIPAHWQVFLIKRHFEVSYGIGGEIDRSLGEGTRLLSLPNITKEGRLQLDGFAFTDAAAPADMLREGDLLFNWRNGSSQHLGKTVRFDLPGCWSHVSFLLRLRARSSKTYSGFLRYLLNGLRETEFFAYAKAGVNNTFNLFEVCNLPVISPPTWAEQHETATFLDTKTAELDVVSDSIASSIAGLDEYRSALITAAVTGQLSLDSAPNKPKPQEA